MSHPTLFDDICRGNHGGNPMSEAAVASIDGGRSEVQARIVEYLRQHGPMTCDEYEQRTGMSHQTASARFSELKTAGRIVAAGKAMTRSGRGAMRWGAA